VTMGNFLDKPITEKETFSGNIEGKKIQFAVSAMQGWRRDMEVPPHLCTSSIIVQLKLVLVRNKRGY